MPLTDEKFEELVWRVEEEIDAVMREYGSALSEDDVYEFTRRVIRYAEQTRKRATRQ